jgi:putative SOS response-associated peptidase YedK
VEVLADAGHLQLANHARVDEFDSHYSAFNARIESVASAPIFREAWRSQRCLVVVDGIIEWVGEKRHKIPHLIRHRERKPLAMAGLWSRWRDGRGGEEIWSCAVIVKDADDWYARFHDRMAVLLSPDAYDEWLDPTHSRGQLDTLATSAYHRDEELDYFPISRLVNNPSYDAPDCLEPPSAEELQAQLMRAKRENAQMKLDL